jgi:hypothetical protein
MEGLILVFAVFALIFGYPYFAREDKNRRDAARNGVHYSPVKDNNGFNFSIVIGAALLLIILGLL